MTSAAEQVMANVNWGTLRKAEELQKRLLFTLGVLIVCRLGSYLPLPGIDAEVFFQAFVGSRRSIVGFFNMFSGGAINRMAIFALGIMPYISASIIVQLMAAVLPAWSALKSEGEAGRKKLAQYARFITILIASLQGYAVAMGLQATEGVVASPGWFFVLSTTITLMGGSLLLMWLGERITAVGVGNGPSLIIFSGIVAEFPDAFVGVLELSRQGVLAGPYLLAALTMMILVIGFVVFMERAQRRLLIQYPRRQVGRELLSGQSSHLPLKVNTAGVIPPIFASALLLMPATLSSMSAGRAAISGEGPGIFERIALFLAPGQPLHAIVYIGLIIFFCFFYTAIVLNPEEIAKNLKKYGGFIPGVRPGDKTAEYIDYVLTRITVLGSVYIAGVCFLPEFLVTWADIPFYFGGTSLLIVVSVTMDTVAQIQGYLFAYQYEGLVGKTKLRKRQR